MTIRSKLRISTLAEILLVIVVGAVLVISSQNISRTNNRGARATMINQAITELRFVTMEQLIKHDERSLEQWYSKFHSIDKLLAPTAGQTPADSRIIADMQRQHQEIKAAFDRLIDSYSRSAAGQSPTTFSNFQEHLASQLLVRQQIQVTAAVGLATIAQAEVKSQQEKSSLAILLIIILMLSVAVGNALVITNNMGRSISSLQKGAQAIAEGKLDYRISDGENDEFGQLATDFNFMAVSLEGLDRIKSEFILLASHQLRTPLTAIKWSSEELTSKKRELNKAQRAHYLKQIHESNERMIKLVTALLNVAKIDLGALPHEPESVQLADVLTDVLKDLSAQISGKHVEIIKHVSSRLDKVLIDPSWARIIFQNLLSNAVRYSSPGQAVTVSINQEAKDILVTFADDGCGIPENQKDKIFTKLFRADNALKMESEGSGLGLYITRAMVEQAGGSIWFESIEDKGTTFYVKLPLDQHQLT